MMGRALQTMHRCNRCNARQQAGILEGFEAIAHKRLRPNGQKSRLLSA
jgi:hypothetical protein